MLNQNQPLERSAERTPGQLRYCTPKELTQQDTVLCSSGRDPVEGSPHLMSPLGPGPEEQAPWNGFGAPT
ncbi:unnamed protein product [Gadus morhua 'NCC']